MTTMVAAVRRFNRTVTQRVGALNDRFLARDRPLAAARLLWEIGPEGCEVRALRTRLDLDSGHASRLLRSLESDGLVTVRAGASDRRVRTALRPWQKYLCQHVRNPAPRDTYWLTPITSGDQGNCNVGSQ